MFGHFKKSASILKDQDTQMVGNDWWPATISNTERWCNCSIQCESCCLHNWPTLPELGRQATKIISQLEIIRL